MTTEKENIYKKLMLIQQEIRAPKNHLNSYSKFMYRKAEDILYIAKPICAKYNTVVFTTSIIEKDLTNNYKKYSKEELFDGRLIDKINMLTDQINKLSNAISRNADSTENNKLNKSDLIKNALEQLKLDISKMAFLEKTKINLIKKLEGTAYYLKGIATLINVENPEEKIIAEGFAKEAISRKGMDDAQVTGACSSYAKKYALEGLFALDDSKNDPDTKNNNT